MFSEFFNIMYLCSWYWTSWPRSFFS